MQFRLDLVLETRLDLSIVGLVNTVRGVTLAWRVILILRLLKALLLE